MFQLIYASRATENVTFDMVQDIIRAARKTNAEAGVTGCLAFNQKFFLQALEGERHAVNRIFNCIIRDQRHQDIELLAYQQIAARSFPDWAMRMCSTKEMNRSILFKYGYSDIFEPLRAPPAAALGLLLELGDASSAD